MTIKAIDLFCGAGGLTHGLINAGIDVIAGFDIDNNLKEVYEKNNIRPNGENVKYYLKAVETLSKKDIVSIIGSKTARKKRKEKFLLAGCAPCQPFSLKNKNRNNKLDFRRTLITYFADLISKTSPDYVLMENVAGLANLEAENLKYFTDILDQEGFFWETNIVNAVNYGVPQNRRRFVLLASKNKKIEFPFGDYYGKAQLYKTVRDTIEKLPALVAGEINNKIPNHKCANLSNLNKMRIKATKQNGGDRLDWDKELWLCCHLDKDGNPKPVHKDTYGRMFWDKPSPTLTTKFNSITTGRYGHPTQDRAISLREGALLQSFPMDYIFYGAMQNIAKQIGNAVPPKMAEVFGKQLFI